MNMSYYGNMNIPGTRGMDKDEQEEMNIYANADASDDVRTETDNTDTKRHHTPQHTGSDTVKTRSSSAAVVCLVLLCVLLLTAVIVLCVHIHTNNTEDRDELLIKITNLTEERDLLLNTIKDFQTEKDQLVIQNQKLANEKKESS
ncbi:CD209 antigen-like protein [Labeo rohita]|uniref:CD209 antigen-like protein n=1 Tax=Labeo rohita TaxID=84645 RepID=A0A498NVM7_LABRO|nr:CD209 antigen-like protein [Labeo rohita]